ncbi:MAG: dihydroneopterin aldolase [Muribaculaceae bacterium]|nr:dihydroneopterin aldolase [Muribaculaceae bacterium]
MGRFVIRLEGLRFYSRIGVFDQERSVGNEFLVDLTAVADASGFRRENLDTTVSYADIYEVVAEAMKREWQLLESVSSHIADTVIDRWTMISDVKVRITKLSPPIPGIQGVCSVEYDTCR